MLGRDFSSKRGYFPTTIERAEAPPFSSRRRATFTTPLAHRIARRRKPAGSRRSEGCSCASMIRASPAHRIARRRKPAGSPLRRRIKALRGTFVRLDDSCFARPPNCSATQAGSRLRRIKETGAPIVRLTFRAVNRRRSPFYARKTGFDASNCVLRS